MQTYNLLKFSLCTVYTTIKTHGHVSAAKKDVQHTSVLFTGTAKSPFSTPHISITTGPISIKFSYIFYALHIHDFTYQICRQSDK